ncbi:MAG: hypothetical protein WDN26_08420 [Chitinophagaceae bacterium]
MSTKWTVNESSRIEEYRETGSQPKNPAVRLAATIISYIFHPLFIPVYIVWFLITYQPYMFSGFSPFEKTITLLRFFIMYTFFPLVTVLLAKGLGFLDSVYLKTQKERIIPYIASMIFYFWMAYVLRHQPEFSKEIIYLTLAIFIASIFGLMLNIYMKVSMHALSIGILLVFAGIIAGGQPSNATVYLSIAILIAGLVCTARFIVSDHTQKEIYIGLLAGAASQIIAVWADGVLP